MLFVSAWKLLTICFFIVKFLWEFSKKFLEFFYCLWIYFVEKRQSLSYLTQVCRDESCSTGQFIYSLMFSLYLKLTLLDCKCVHRGLLAGHAPQIAHSSNLWEHSDLGMRSSLWGQNKVGSMDIFLTKDFSLLSDKMPWNLPPGEPSPSPISRFFLTMTLTFIFIHPTPVHDLVFDFFHQDPF